MGDNHERIRWIEHQGENILVIDYTNLKAAAFLATAREVESFYAGSVPDSMLVMVDVTGAFTDSEVVNELKRLAKACKPFEKRCAVVGVKGVKKILLQAIEMFSNRKFATFDAQEPALAWLIAP